jgi:hypothetical protein
MTCDLMLPPAHADRVDARDNIYAALPPLSAGWHKVHDLFAICQYMIDIQANKNDSRG